MTMPSIRVEYIDRYVKVFLSCAYAMSPDEDHPWWDKCNVLLLLNFHDQIDY